MEELENIRKTQIFTKNGKDISERAKAEANVVMLRKYVTLLFKETKVD